MSKIGILIADDHAILRAGLRLLINLEQDMEVIGEAKNGAEAIEKAPALRPNVILMDISMPEMNGIKAIEQLQRVYPQGRILVLTMHEDPAYVRSTLAAGSSGYLVKSSADGELIAAIRSVNQGRIYIDQRLGSSLIFELIGTARQQQNRSPKNLLSRREREVLQLLAQGHTYQQIADHLCVSVKTVESYRSRFIEKLGLRSRADLIRYASETGFLSNSKLPDRTE